MRGWLAGIHSERNPHRQIAWYERLASLFDFFGNWTILPFDDQAADEFTGLQKLRLRVGTSDLKIAAIALTRDATVLTANLRDFARVPGLRVEDWMSA